MDTEGVHGGFKNQHKKNQIADAHIIGVGVGVPGPVDVQGIVNRCVNLGWGMVDLHGGLLSFFDLLYTIWEENATTCENFPLIFRKWEAII